MKFFYHLFLMIVVCSGFIQEDSKINQLLNAPIQELPLNTKKIDIKKCQQLNKDKILNYIVFNDTSKLKYYFHTWDNDLDINTIQIKEYKYYLIAAYKHQKGALIIYSKGGNHKFTMFLRSYINEKIIDTLVIGTEEGESEINRYTEGQINKDLSVITTTLEYNPSYNKKEFKNTAPPTQATITRYQIDSITGKINLLSEQKMYSDCIPEEFTYKDSKCVLHP